MDTTQRNLLWAVRDRSNRQAWVDFYSIYAPMVSGFVRRMGLPNADADDATQEIMLAAQAALEKGAYKPEKGKFRAWLFGVARNQARLAHRARRRPSRAQMIASDSSINPLAQLEDPHAEADRLIWEQEWRYALLGEALNHLRCELPDKEYQAFIRYGVNCRPVEQVADELGLSSSSVYVYKSRVVQALRKWTEQFEQE
ncbi:MAG: sigma-70 family RNA polymerase sigma factor [Phycisphaerae bacterium]|nr:sigma-70 family RNA polymerase sigma factor [Phycisphaerae bacterium]